MQSGQFQAPAGSATPLAAMLRAAGSCAAVCVAAKALAASAALHDDPRTWLARTDEALSNRNYIGVFVHEHAGESETLRVIHRVDGEGAAERLLSMDGSGREFIRKGSQLFCYLPDQRTVLVEKGPGSALLLSGLPHIDASSAGQYELRELARARVSGRDARVIAIAPLDGLRYGYRVWVDERTAMPLKTQLRDSHGGVLEQIVFTSLNMLARIPKGELEPAIDARGYRWIRRDAEPVEQAKLSVSWQADALPAGFRMTASARQMLPGGPVEHLVFSDGLASVSVFVEPGRTDAAGPDRDDAATLGTSSAFSTIMQGYRVTVVGEVPPETVRVIAQAIRGAGPPQSAETVVDGASAGAPRLGVELRDGAGPGIGFAGVAPAVAPAMHSFGAGAARGTAALPPAAGAPARH